MKKIHHLEGIRGVGAMIVFICHFQIIVLPNFYHSFFLLLNQKFSFRTSNFIVTSSNLMINGNMFLHIFWALSAYVIFKKFFEYGAGEGAIMSACVKRYFRLMIPCAAAIFFSYGLYRAGLIYVRGIPVETIQQNLYLIPPSFLHALKTSVWSTLFNYDYFNSYNGPLWTIEREFYGSLFCFALFGIIGKTKNRGVFYAVIFAVVLGLKMYWLNSFLFGYYLSDYDFTASIQTNATVQKINTYIHQNQKATVLAFVLTFIAGKVILYKLPDQLDLVNSFLCFLVIFISLRIDAVTRFMGGKVLTALGKVSFGLYLLHWPIICSFTSWFYLRYNNGTYAFAGLLFVLSITLSLALAWVFYKVVDLNSITISGRIAKFFGPKTETGRALKVVQHAEVAIN